MDNQQTHNLSSEVIEKVLADPDIVKKLVQPDKGEKVFLGGNCHVIVCPDPANLKFVLCSVDIDNEISGYNPDTPSSPATSQQFPLLYGVQDNIADNIKRLNYLKDKLSLKRKEVEKIKEIQNQEELDKIKLEAIIDEKNNTMAILRTFFDIGWIEAYSKEITRLKGELKKKVLFLEGIQGLLKQEIEKQEELESAVQRITKELAENLSSAFDK